MDLNALIAARKAALAGIIARRDALRAEGQAILDTVTAEARTELTEEERTRHLDTIQERATLDSQIASVEGEITALEASFADDQRQTVAALEQRATGATAQRTTTTVTERRTYSADSDPKGVQFLRDVALAQVMGVGQAQERLSQHMREEIHERAAAGRPLVDREVVNGAGSAQRAVGTGAFSGLVVPQYLTDLFAPIARAGRPFADACTHHDLPEQGMNVYIGKLTTGTTTADQAAEGDTVNETDADDTLLTIPVRTTAGSQSVSRQAVERGVGIDDTIVADLFRAHDTKRDSNLINLATVGLAAVATSIAYTDASPTAAELYPKTLAAPAAVEAALLDQGLGDTFGIMHSRRWYWMLSQLTSTWPMFATQGQIPAQAGGLNYVEKYGPGFRGLLPSGVPFIVDNNIATNLGAGTNEDEMYFAAKSELHLWEDPTAPMLIKAEQTQSKKLLIDLVVYSYYAFEFTRRAHAQKIAGTGLVTPTF